MHGQRTKVVTAAAAVTLLASIGLWAGISDDGASGPPSSGSTPAVGAEPSDRHAEESVDASEGDERTATRKNRRKTSSGAGAKDEGAGARDDSTRSDDGSGTTADTGSNDAASGDSSSDSSGDSAGDSGEEPEPETTPTYATGETVEVGAVQTAAPVPLDSVGDFGTGLTVRLAEIAPVDAEAKAPGEIAGPAVRVRVDAVNDGDDAVPLDGVVVFVSYGAERVPASQFGSSSDPLAGELAPGGSRSGTYVYALPPDARNDVRVEISYTGSAPTVAFEGSLDG